MPSDRPRRLIPDADAPLPEGDEKTASVQAMFDIIAPRYDLVNRVMTFRMDVGWRRRTVDALGPRARARWWSTWPAEPVTSPVTSAARGHVPIGRRPQLRHAGGRARSRSPECRPTGRRSRSPTGRSTARRAGSRCGTSPTWPPPSPSWPGSSGPAAASRCWRWRSRRSTLMRFGHGIYFGQVVPRIGGLLSDGAAYRYLPRSVAYLPPPDELVALIADCGFTDVRRSLLSGGIAQLLTATRGPPR